MIQVAASKTTQTSSAAVYLPGKFNEDRNIIIEEDTDLKLSAYGVFDGHGGSYGSQVCSDKFCSDVLISFKQRLSQASIINAEVYDVHFCDSVLQTAKALNDELKCKSRTGSTISCIFVRKLEDESYDVYCVNVGDSRCIMNHKDMIVPMSEDHSLKTTRELLRIRAHELAEWIPRSVELKIIEVKKINSSDCSIMYRRIFHTTPDQMVQAKRIIEGNYDGLLPDESFATTPATTRLTMFDQFAKRLSTLPETSPIKKNKKVEGRASSMSLMRRFTSFGKKFGATPRTARTTEDDSDNSDGDGLDSRNVTNHSNELPGEDLERDSDIQVDETTSIPYVVDVGSMGTSSHGIGISHHSIHDKRLKNQPRNYVNGLDDDNEYITMPIIHEKSFIAKRTNENGDVKGPLSLFSRHGVSITMTRSIGDRHAARTCVYIPEVTKFRVPAESYARFILGSDGLWDVMTNEKAVKMTRHLIEPIEVGKVLCNTARFIREENHIKIDDITCVVVDINPTHHPYANASPCQVS